MAVPRSFIAGTVTAVAPVAAIPTTAAHFVLYNAEPAGGKTYTISSLGFTPNASAGAAFVAQLLAHVGLSTAGTPPVGTTAAGPLPLDCGVKDSRAVARSAATIVNNGIWHPVGLSVNGGAATATISMGSWVYVRGIYMIPPGGSIALAVLCSAAGSATCQLFATWEEA